MSDSPVVRGSAAITDAIRATAMLVEAKWQQLLLVLVGFRGFCECRSWARLPICIAIYNADIAALRRLLVMLCPANSVWVQSLTGFSVVSLAETRFAIQDLSASPQWMLVMARQWAYDRSLPDGAIPKGRRTGAEVPVYGDSLNIVPYDFANETLAWGHVVVVEGGGLVDIPLMESAVRNWAVCAKFLAPFAASRLVLSADAVPYHPACSRYLHRGFVADAALAAALEELTGVGGFVEAVLKSWETAVRHAIRTATPRQKDAVALKYVLHYIAANDPDRNSGFREDLLAADVRSRDRELFASFDQVALGRVLARRGVGSVSRHGFEVAKDDESIDPPRIFRTVVRFSDDDIKLMEEIANELPE